MTAVQQASEAQPAILAPTGGLASASHAASLRPSLSSNHSALIPASNKNSIFNLNQGLTMTLAASEMNKRLPVTNIIANPPRSHGRSASNTSDTGSRRRNWPINRRSVMTISPTEKASPSTCADSMISHIYWDSSSEVAKAEY